MGKTKIAGETNDKAAFAQPAIRIIGRFRAYLRNQRGPVWDEAGLVARHLPIAGKMLFGISSNDDNRIQCPKHPRIGASYHSRGKRIPAKKSGHDKRVRIEVVDD